MECERDLERRERKNMYVCVCVWQSLDAHSQHLIRRLIKRVGPGQEITSSCSTARAEIRAGSRSRSWNSTADTTAARPKQIINTSNAHTHTQTQGVDTGLALRSETKKLSQEQKQKQELEPEQA